jgi:hypothetical protein
MLGFVVEERKGAAMRKVLVFAVAGAALTIGGTTAALASSSHTGTDDSVRPSSVSTVSGTPTHSTVPSVETSTGSTVPESSATSVPSTYPSADRHGGRGVGPGDDRGRTTVEPGDDHGGRGAERGDDHGNHHEAGDDHGGRR